MVIVVPCFNEEQRLDTRSFLDYSGREPNVAFLMVDDGSGDATGDVLRRLACALPDRIQVLALPRNMGKSEAVRHGIRHALERNPDVVGYWDADLATPLEAIHDLLLEFQRPEVEIVLGSRVKLLGRHIHRRSIRHYAGRVFATLTSWALRLEVYDTQCGAKLFRCTPQLPRYFDRPFSSRWLIDVEILARALTQPGRRGVLVDGGGLVEYPLHEWRDVAGTKLRPLDMVTAVGALARIWARYRP